MKKKEFNYRINSNENPTNNYQEEKSILLKKLIDLNLSNSQISNLTLSRGDLTRILYYNQIYQHILGKPGSIMEFGVQYGLSLSLLLKLRPSLSLWLSILFTITLNSPPKFLFGCNFIKKFSPIFSQCIILIKNYQRILSEYIFL